MQQIDITTSRLKIRHLHIEDLEPFYTYRSNPEVTKYQGFDVMTMEKAKAFIEDNATKQFGKPGEWVQYAIAVKKTGKLIGDCAIKFNVYDIRLAEIGISISPQEQKKGYAKEAVTAILNLLFSREDFHRVTETVDAKNIAAIQLLKSIGFREEGHFIENIFFKSKWSSEYQYAMIWREWLEIQRRM